MNRGIPGTRILALVADKKEEVSLINRAENPVPDHQVVRAEDFSDWSAAHKHIWNLAGRWMEVLEGVQVSFLKTTARNLPGLMAQLKELLPIDWQESGLLTNEKIQLALDLYQLGV